MSSHRPVGVTILGILEIVFGLLGLVGGGCVGISGLLGFSAGVTAGGQEGAQFATLAGVTGVSGLVTTVLSIVGIVLGVGLLLLKGWAYRLALVFVVVGIVWSLISGLLTVFTFGGTSGIVNGLIGALPSILVQLIILYYLRQPSVKAAFNA